MKKKVKNRRNAFLAWILIYRLAKFQTNRLKSVETQASKRSNFLRFPLTEKNAFEDSDQLAGSLFT